MSLTSEINRTETEKNKTKQVATQIDNKLIELGGEQAKTYLTWLIKWVLW